MNSWYILSIAALFLMGTQRFLYKVSAERKCSSPWTTFSFMTTVTILSSILFIISKERVLSLKFLVFISIVNSGSFVLGTIAHMEALKYVPAGIVYPIIRLNVVFVVIFAIVFFRDHLSVFQVIGIFTALIAMFILTRSSQDHASMRIRIKRGFVFVFISLFSGSIASISSKFAAMYTNKLAFMAMSYLLGALFSLGLAKTEKTGEADRNLKDALFIGFGMGLINFVGFYSFLKALTLGPLSIIVSITGMHFVIAVILSSLIYKEALTSLRIVGISMTIVSILLLRLR